MDEDDVFILGTVFKKVIPRVYNYTCCISGLRFDRGLIGFDDDFRILISSCFAENTKSTYSLKQFAGKQILLPENELFYPSIESLKWHRENKFILN